MLQDLERLWNTRMQTIRVDRLFLLEKSLEGRLAGFFLALEMDWALFIKTYRLFP
jgi:hypothetical protein